MVLKKHLSLQNLKKTLLNIYKNNKEKIFDIVVFGSFVKGKDIEFIGDIDICIILKQRDKPMLNDLDKLKDMHINYLYLTELYTQPLWRTLIREGISLIHNKRLFEMFEFKSYGLYVYELKGLKNKSRFSQVLNGYKSESVLKKVNGIALKPGVILVPIENVEYFRTFLDTWNVKYTLKYTFIF